MEDDFVGAIKIKDGLFIGDEYAAQDFEFAVTNKVTHIINCAGRQIPNYWETVGVQYLTFDWADSETQIVFDTKGEVVNEIYEFIEEAVRLGEGVLVHSVKGQSRSCCVLTAYFMKRYRWSLYKTLEFLTSRRSDLEIRTSFYHQLLNLESRLFQQTDGNVTVNWQEIGTANDIEELLLRNTFLNARSAPFDEALVNPQLGVDMRPRKLNWGDEKPSNKDGLYIILNKETLASLATKPNPTSIKSIMKGSNKVFKLKGKSGRPESPIITSKGNASPALRVNKSMRNFSEGRNSDGLIDDANVKINPEKSVGIADKIQGPSKITQSPNMSRSSSATIFDKEENARAAASKGSFAGNDKTATNPKISNINGNIIHLTVNNYLAPVNNLNNPAQTNAFPAEKETKSKPSSAKPGEYQPTSQKYNLPTDIKSDEPESNKIDFSESSYSRLAKSADKSTTNYLKSAIEKKLSKEYKSQFSSTLMKGEVQPVIAKSFNNDKIAEDVKELKPLKEYAKPTDIKVNYQVLLKNRETPPPRKRDESKKVLDSPQRKAVSKSSISSTKAGDSNLPYSSYLNSLFSTSLSQLNTVTPSAYGTNYQSAEKKTPISTKATPVTYNLSLAQKAQALARPQRTTNQTIEKNYSSSMLGSSLNKAKILPNEPSSATSLTSKFNNYMSQTKGNPIKVSYEKVDRPHSATPDRSATPQAGMKRLGTSISSGFNSKSSEQRSSAPLKNSKHVTKDSGSTQELLAKYRQRSSSPLQVGYNPVLSSSSISFKGKGKY